MLDLDSKERCSSRPLTEWVFGHLGHPNLHCTDLDLVTFLVLLKICSEHKLVFSAAILETVFDLGGLSFTWANGPPEVIFHGHRWPIHQQKWMTYLPSRRLWLLRTTPLPEKDPKAKTENICDTLCDISALCYRRVTFLSWNNVTQSCRVRKQPSKILIIGNKSKSARSWKVQKGVTHAWNRASSLTHHNYLVLVTE